MRPSTTRSFRMIFAGVFESLRIHRQRLHSSCPERSPAVTVISTGGSESVLCLSLGWPRCFRNTTGGQGVFIRLTIVSWIAFFAARTPRALPLTAAPDLFRPNVEGSSGACAYITWLARGYEVGKNLSWRGQNAIADANRIPVAKLDPKRGEALFMERCVNCHGMDGAGVAIGEKKAAPCGARIHGMTAQAQRASTPWRE